MRINKARRELGNKFVTIYVGPEKKEFTVHRNVICQNSDYFAKAFESPFQEGQTGTMFLSDDSPIVFSIFVTWLYRRVIPTGNTASHLHNLADAYIFADKICHGVLKDEIMNEIQDITYKFQIIDPLISQKFLGKVFNNTDSEGLGKFCMWLLAAEYMKGNFDKTHQFDDSKLDDSKLVIVWELSKEHFVALKMFQDRAFHLACWKGKWWDPRNRPSHGDERHCRFHCHEQSFNCESKKAKVNEEFIDDLNIKEEEA